MDPLPFPTYQTPDICLMICFYVCVRACMRASQLSGVCHRHTLSERQCLSAQTGVILTVLGGSRRRVRFATAWRVRTDGCMRAFLRRSTCFRRDWRRRSHSFRRSFELCFVPRRRPITSVPLRTGCVGS